MVNPQGHDKIVQLARGLVGGLLLEQAAHDAGLSLSTAIHVSGSDAFKHLLAEQHALRVAAMGSQAGVIS